MDEYQSLSHTKWECKYHVVFIPKYRRQKLYGSLRKHLGNLFREKGQVTRAINTHQALLQRPDLRPIEHAHVLLCLGLDFRRGGFVRTNLDEEDVPLSFRRKAAYY